MVATLFGEGAPTEELLLADKAPKQPSKALATAQQVATPKP